MNRVLWSIFLITTICIGYLVGYSIPPMLEAGLIGNRAQPQSIASSDGAGQAEDAVAGDEPNQPGGGAAGEEVDPSLLEYYRSLQQTDPK